ncbi:ATPase [bacterium (Candidatus Blackallbacteria) CG17_big_fil_post_rev_8_21_14_2_50_48_46]|uniref:ATPase n=1 Tax=bacterium (Candidatus Blackallbacteria) CG17_big_fil_post_rev_8_21_14_2_50_48_46 TaxID=2014261 RepID=A0A2M7G7U0_9BACT|nr:MAG: ATPase [bacterium (Candidatus Blackallbacteria) CG18_big_fil_WC_8_21_14_2_50_49_26]PIW17814.1 MAG: ATPase [bacterium (Candidatus Blackallbacteria) CG17_big_fil_post_rev_8_21_14_2_50_48_46]PIW48490.1 MAG: ATPase [bacterium (Candidatus Blackallbacteria) CG13_big_fil_rev_8_21_14_2_50_49_14]
MSEWYTQSVQATLQAQAVSMEQGLSPEEAAQRLQSTGPNELTEKGIKSPWLILWEQLTSIMVLILLAAAGLSAFLGDYSDAIVILAIVVFFAVLGLIQEYRAEKAIAALKQLAEPLVHVKRGGSRIEISARELVPGDLLYLETGNIVPADCRLIEAINLKIQEAALTGESEPVEKNTALLSEKNLSLGDQHNMAYMGTIITYGRGMGLVIGTGMQTQLGKIATLLETVEAEATPLQKKLDQVGKTLAILAIAISGLIFLLGVLRGEDWKHMLLSAVSVAVAAVPEGLPAVLTITLAFGSQRMLKRHALVRKLTGIETLGSVSVICSDKTGTLTQNRMTVKRVVLADHIVAITPGSPPETSLESALLNVCGVLCNDGHLEATGEALGDPTETALLIAARHWKLEKQALEILLPRLAELPFDSERKRMTTLHSLPDAGLPKQLEAALDKHLPDSDWLSLTKGAPDGLLELSSHYLSQAGILTLTPQTRQELLEANEKLAAQGMRVLGFALRSWQKQPETTPKLETELIFLGMVGMIDPPRPEVLEAVKVCQTAGIRPIMITGDHPLTAQAIAQELGITHNNKVLTGQDLHTLSPQALGQALQETSVFARVSPEHKLQIVNALQAQNRVVAMTGDGVNDAPALKKADIGVAMGITGTDVAKEAADMVLQDDNFATIVAAVEEGRIIYDNLRKFIKYSVAGNLGKILVMLLAPLLNMPLALLPIQMLWLNLLTDGLLGFGIGMEKAEPNIMQRPPVPPDESILGGKFRWQVTWMGCLIGGISFVLGALSFLETGPQGHWQSIFFTSLAVAQIFQALAIRSSQQSIFSKGLAFSNPSLTGMIAASILLQTVVIYLPWFQQFFHTAPLNWTEISIIVAANSCILWISEGMKLMHKSV